MGFITKCVCQTSSLSCIPIFSILCVILLKFAILKNNNMKLQVYLFVCLFVCSLHLYLTKWCLLLCLCKLNTLKWLTTPNNSWCLQIFLCSLYQTFIIPIICEKVKKHLLLRVQGLSVYTELVLLLILSDGVSYTILYLRIRCCFINWKCKQFVSKRKPTDKFTIVDSL